MELRCPTTLFIIRIVSNQPGDLYEDKHLTVNTVPLRHSIPVVGFVFREKKRPLNIRKEAIEKYNLGIRDIRQIKDGHDFTTPSGETIPNSELTHPPLPNHDLMPFARIPPASRNLQNTLKILICCILRRHLLKKIKNWPKLTGHSTAGQAAKLAKLANVGKLLIGHFSTRYKNINLLINEAREIFPETYAVEDGEKYPVNQQAC